MDRRERNVAGLALVGGGTAKATIIHKRNARMILLVVISFKSWMMSSVWVQEENTIKVTGKNWRCFHFQT